MLFKLEQEKQFNEFWAVYPRRVGKGAAQKRFIKALGRDRFKNIMDGLAVMVEAYKSIEKRFIPHAATWLHQDRWLDELETTEITIENPHPELEKYCGGINEKYKKSQRAKGNWSKLADITSGKHVIDGWLKKSTLDGWDKWQMIGKILEAMQRGTVVTSFTHWEARLK